MTLEWKNKLGNMTMSDTVILFENDKPKMSNDRIYVGDMIYYNYTKKKLILNDETPAIIGEKDINEKLTELVYPPLPELSELPDSAPLSTGGKTKKTKKNKRKKSCRKK